MSNTEDSSLRKRHRKKTKGSASEFKENTQNERIDILNFETPVAKKVSFAEFPSPASESGSQKDGLDDQKLDEVAGVLIEEDNSEIEEILRNMATSERKNNSPRQLKEGLSVDRSLTPVKNAAIHPKLHLSPPMSPESVFISAPNSFKTHFIVAEGFDPESAIADYKKYQQLPSQNEAIACNHYINRLRVDAIADGDYDKAAEMESLATSLRRSINTRAVENQQSDKIESLNSRLEAVKTDLFIKTRDWEVAITKEKEASKQRIMKLDEEHEKQLEELDDNWNSPHCLRDFSKPSAELIRLRRAERSLVLSKKYKKAKEIKHLADKLELEETERNQEKGYQEMLKQRSALITHQEEERRLLERKLKDHLKVLRSKRDAEIQVIEKRIQKFNKLIEECKTDRIYVPMTPVETKSGMMTPRTTHKIQQFRTSPYLKPLKIQPMRAKSALQKKRKIRVRAGEMFD